MSITFGNIIDMARRTIATPHPQLDDDGENAVTAGDYMPDVAHESARRRTYNVIVSDRIDQGEAVHRQPEQRAS